MHPGVDNEFINSGNAIQCLFIHAGDDLFDCCQTVDFIAGIDALRAVADLEINAAAKAGFLLEDRDADVLGHAGIYSRFIDDNRTGRKIAADDPGGVLQWEQIGGLILFDWSRNCNDQKLRFAQPLLVRGKIDRRTGNGLIAHLMRRVDAALVLLDSALIVVKADHLDVLGKFHRNGHTNIAKAD